MNPYLNTTQKNISWFNNAHRNGELDMKPPFQRNPVWVTKQKSYLIDSILNGYPIPEVYMQEVVDEGGNSKHIVVDGQQRIRAVLEFVAGEFGMDPKDSPSFADMTFEDLTKEQKQTIFGYNFVIRVIPDLPDEQIREIFQRLNKNVVSLNAQELRQATYWGQFISTMNEISNLTAWSDMGLFTPNDIRRMLDVEYISELATAFLHGVQNKKAKLDYYYQLYEEEFDEANKVKDAFESVLGEITKILPELRKTRWNKKSDFYTLFLVFASNHQSLPLSRDSRPRAAQFLLEFASAVDQFGKTNKEGVDDAAFSDNVKTYSKAVIRSASDLGSRKNRELALETELESIWN